MNAIWDPAALAQGFWQGVFELLALSIIAAFGTFIFQRRQARYTLREELIDSINQFAISLYKPRKLYQAIIDRSCDPLAHIADAPHREARHSRRSIGRWKMWSPPRGSSASCRSS